MRRITAALAVATLGALALGACGSDEPPPGAAETGENPPTTAVEATTTSAPEESTTTTEAAAPQPIGEELSTFDVSATEYSYSGDLAAGAEVPAGLVQINLTNTGAEEHQATIVRFHDGVTFEQFAAEGGSDPTGQAALALVDGFGGPNAAGPGGGTSSAVTNLTPGDYLMICFIPAPDGQPHAAKGMLTPFTVTDATPADTELADDELSGEIGLDEFAFVLPDEFSGQGTYAVTDEGEQTHEIAVYQLADGATADDVVAFFADPASASGPPPITPTGGAAAQAPGSTTYVTLDLAPGDYVAMCFLPDVSSDGAPHFTKGMIQPFTVEG
jgi:hypothetical protein